MVVATGDGTMAAGRGGHDSRAVANRFVALAREQGEILTILQLVKFVYLAHGWHLGFYDKPLICHDVEAWRLGPVVPEVYRAFRPQGVVMTAMVKPQDDAEPYNAKFDESAQSITGEVFKSYSRLSPFALSSLTHKPGTPWHRMKGKGHYAIIPDEIIRDYYLRKVREQDKK